MINKFKYYLAVLCSFMVVLTPALASAATPDICGQSASSAKGQVLYGAKQSGTDCGGGVKNVISVVITTLSVVVGIVAVIMIIVSGFKYVTSSGDSGKISNAKTTLIYAIVGIVIAVLAQVIVNFAIDVSANNPCQYNPSISATDNACVSPAPK